MEFLTTDLAAAHLQAKGLKISSKTMAKLRVVGGGPKYRKWGRLPVYDEANLDTWAEPRLSEYKGSTSGDAAG